ncbi:MAG: signal peptidase II [Clostridia bacterium]|nr:signal peptidase II [Clostridia bacterium]
MILLFILLLFVDQYTKYLTRKYLVVKKTKKYFQLQFVRNKGAALGFMKKHPKILMLINALVLVMIAYMLYRGYKLQEPFIYLLALVLILSGGIGNNLDRLWKGYVTDFLKPGHKKMPYFNMADFYILLGVVLLVTSEWLYDIQ